MEVLYPAMALAPAMTVRATMVDISAAVMVLDSTMVVLHPPNVAEVETMMVMGLEISGPYSIKGYVDSLSLIHISEPTRPY